jgi:hypothetical protein
MAGRNIRKWSKRPLWSDQGTFCTACDKFAFPRKLVAEKLQELKTKPQIAMQESSEILHAYACPHGNGWHIGHDYGAAAAKAVEA